MAAPLVVIVGIVARATTTVLTKPHVYLFLLGWIVVAKFDFGVFSKEAQEAAASLWWLILLVLITFIIIAAIKAHAAGGRSK